MPPSYCQIHAIVPRQTPDDVVHIFSEPKRMRKWSCKPKKANRSTESH